MKKFFQVVFYGFIIFLLVIVIITLFKGVGWLKGILGGLGFNITSKTYNYGQQITYNLTDDNGYTRNAELIIPIYVNEECTQTAYLKTTMWKTFWAGSDISYYYSADGVNYSPLGTTGFRKSGWTNKFYPNYTKTHNISYYLENGKTYRIDWGTHFEVLSNLSTYYFLNYTKNHSIPEGTSTATVAVKYGIYIRTASLFAQEHYYAKYLDYMSVKIDDKWQVLDENNLLTVDSHYFQTMFTRTITTDTTAVEERLIGTRPK